MKPIKTRLLRTPRPYAGESFKGLIVRAAEENGYDSPAPIFKLADMTVDLQATGCVYTEQNWENLSRVLNIDSSVLKGLAGVDGLNKRISKAYVLFGQKISRYHVRLCKPRICPGCLKEKKYINKIWDISAYTCCTDHKTMLIETCPNCGAPISWNRLNLSVCKCGQDWRDIPLTEIPETELILSRLVLLASRSRQVAEDNSNETSDAVKVQSVNNFNPLQTLGLAELFSAVYFVASQQLGVTDTTGKHYAARMTFKELHEALKKAVAIFDNWPADYFELLEESRGRNASRNSSSGLYKDFGWHYEAMFKEGRNRLPDFIRTAFKHYLVETWTGGYAGWCSKISAEELKTKKYMTNKESARYLKVVPNTVTELLDMGHLRGCKSPLGGRHRMTIEADSVIELKARWDKAISPIEAGEMLGVGRESVVSMESSGCLTAIRGPLVSRQVDRKFEVSQVEGLLQQVEKKISQKQRKIGASMVGFHKAIRKLSRLRINVGEFVKLILNGEIAPVAKGEGVGLAALLFDAAEVDWLSIENAVMGRMGTYNMKEAMSLLHINGEEAVFFVKRGFLSAERIAFGRGATWSLTQEAIDQFINTYCTVGKIAKSLKSSHRSVLAGLIAHGVMPVSGPKIDGGRRYFFKRVDIESLNLQEILSKAQKAPENERERLGSKRQFVDFSGYRLKQIKQLRSRDTFLSSSTVAKEEEAPDCSWGSSPINDAA